ncbi:hypothetical protein PMI08_04742, partial [Brevibacillus sp. CF112]
GFVEQVQLQLIRMRLLAGGTETFLLGQSELLLVSF